MTDRIRHLTVTLDKDIREDDVQSIVVAISMVKHVHRVELGEPVGAQDYFARQAVSADLERKLYKVIGETFRPDRPSVFDDV